jgi:hypothetical protein
LTWLRRSRSLTFSLTKVERIDVVLPVYAFHLPTPREDHE